MRTPRKRFKDWRFTHFKQQKILATKALGLPQSHKYLEEQPEEDKHLAISLQKLLERYLMQQSFNAQPQDLDMETTTTDSCRVHEVTHEDVRCLGTVQYQTTLGIEQINFNI